MKNIYSVRFASALAAIGLLAILIDGCGKNESRKTTSPSSVASVEKTSFTEVTAQLDPGGDFYLYLGTAQWLDGLSSKISNWRQTFASMPNVKPEDVDNINKGFDLVTRLVKDSGIEDVSGVGLSSVQIEKGMYRNKALLHHYQGKGDGFLWQLAGKEPHALTDLDMLPTDTALAIFSDVDLPVLWTVAQKEVAASNIPKAQEFLQQLPSQFEKHTRVKWDDFIHSLGGEFGFVLTLNPSNNVPVPLPGAALQIPEPGLLIAVKVNDDTIFNRIDQELKSNQQVISVDKPGLKMRTMPVPLPLPIALRPSAASSGGYLLIASTDSLIDEVLAVKAGQKAGLKSSDEFKHISQGLPDHGNQFVYVSQRFSDTMMQVQQQAITSSAKTEPGMSQWMQSLMKSRPAFTYAVGVNTPEGCLTIGNGSQSYSSTVLLPAVAVPGMLAAIAIPNFVKARTVSQQNACINNLRQIDAAKQQWALENNKTNNETPTKENILPYLRSWPSCPQGGTYSINALNEQPTCSIPNHHLQ